MADRTVLEQYCGSNDFRPEFTKLGQLRAIMTEVPYMALTTTATEKSRFKICNTLLMKNAITLHIKPNRPNMSYQVVGVHGSLQ